MSMTRQQFLTALSHLPPTFVREDDGEAIRFRFRGRTYCPLTAVCEVVGGQFWQESDYVDAADALGVEFDADVVAESADDEYEDEEYDLWRRDMLEALDVKPDVVAEARR